MTTTDAVGVFLAGLGIGMVLVAIAESLIRARGWRATFLYFCCRCAHEFHGPRRTLCPKCGRGDALVRTPR